MKYILSIILLILTIFISGCTTSYQNETYKTNLLKTYDYIQGYSESNFKNCSLHSTVWKNAIRDNKDFNIELKKLSEELENNGMYNYARYNKTSIDTRMKEVSNPPKGYEKAHDKLVEMYGIYSQLYSLSLNPSGSLVSYNNTINDLQSKLVKASSEFNVLLP
jgi:hypothetical protein